MQEKLLQELLKRSSDFILVLNASGSVLQVGEHLQAALLEQGLDGEALAVMVKEHAAQLIVQDTVSLPLDKKGIWSSPFSLMFRDHERIVLLAADTPMKSGIYAVIDILAKAIFLFIFFT